MTEEALREQFERRLPALSAWGEFVTATILDRVKVELARVGDKRSVEEFLKIPPKVRVKALGSFLGKALHRGKPYTNPIEEITDQVGVRFVVLLSSETVVVGGAVVQGGEWDAQQDRGFLRERAARPHFFEYESDHFVVRSSVPRTIGGVEVPVGLPCEVQVRTLLQHAYAELSHDRLYKPECKVPDAIHRLVARGSALLETTDNVFCQVSEGIADALRLGKDAHEAAMAVCAGRGIATTDANAQVSLRLIENFPDEAPAITAESLEEMLKRRDYVPRKMRAHAGESSLFAQPAGLITYWLLDRLEGTVARKWPFELRPLELAAADLGISLHGA